MSKPKYYITTQLHDADSPLTADSIYGAVLGDAIARHKRMCGFAVTHLTGTNAPNRKPSAGDPRPNLKAPPTRDDDETYKKMLGILGVNGSTNLFSTSSPEHARAVEVLLLRTMRRSRHAIYLDGAHEGRYCPHDRIEIAASARPLVCPRCGRPAELISEERHFFRLSAFRNRLLALYEYRPEFIQPRSLFERVWQLLAAGLADVPISVPARYGSLPWPGDPRYAVCDGYSKLVAYMSGIGFGENGYASDSFRRNWPPDLDVTGPSELNWHALYWPAFLMAAEITLPRHVLVHAPLRADPEDSGTELVREADAGPFASDAVRYYLLRTAHHAEINRIDHRAVAARYTTDLALGLEDLTQRVLFAVREHGDGMIPHPSLHLDGAQSIEALVADLRAEVRILLDAFNFSAALTKIWSLIGVVQSQLAALPGEQDLNGSEAVHVRDVVHNASQSLGWIALLLHPILPRVTDAIWKALGQTTLLGDQLIDETPWFCLRPGTPVGDFIHNSDDIPVA